MKKKKFSKWWTRISILVILGLALFCAYQYKTEQELNLSISMLEEELNANRQTVYVAKTLIEKGDAIVATGADANVEQQVIYTGLESYNYISAAEVGMKAVVDIPSGMPVLYNMITDIDITNDLREYEIAAVNLTTEQEVNDLIDVRVTFPDGSDYVVLSKKQIISLNLENCVYSTYLNEEEILRFTCAMVDAYTITGARLYTTKYIEGSLQESAVVNYPVREATRNLISTNPNVITLASETLNVNARMELEARLGALSEDQLDSVNAGFGLVDTAKTSVMGEKASAEGTNGTTSSSSSATNTNASPIQNDGTDGTAENQ